MKLITVQYVLATEYWTIFYDATQFRLIRFPTIKQSGMKKSFFTMETLKEKHKQLDSKKKFVSPTDICFTAGIDPASLRLQSTLEPLRLTDICFVTDYK